MDLAGKSVLITGAARIGATVATCLARAGADIALSYRHSRDEATRIVDTVQSIGGRALAFEADLRDDCQCVELVARVVQAFGRLDALIAMASVYVKTPFDTLCARQWTDGLAVDLSAAFHCARAAVPHMRAQRAGRIVLFADSDAASGRPRRTGYMPHYVAKAGVVALGQALALELAPASILVNTIALGPVLPADDTSVADAEAMCRAIPVGRWGAVQEVAQTVRAVLESDFMTGEVVRLDGGRHLT